MQTRPTTETVIEELVAVACGEQAGARQRHVYREALRSLVRLAKSEQMHEMKADVGRLTGALAAGGNDGHAARPFSLTGRA